METKIVDPDCKCGCCCDLNEVPESLGCLFGDDIILDNKVRKLYVTLGQFSIIRLERDIQLLMPAYDICMPVKECTCNGANCQLENPCDIFERFEFPVDEFFPRDKQCECPRPKHSYDCDENRSSKDNDHKKPSCHC